jgi:hypothetical protein
MWAPVADTTIDDTPPSIGPAPLPEGRTTYPADQPNSDRRIIKSQRRLRDDHVRSLGWKVAFFKPRLVAIITTFLNLIGFISLYFGLQNPRERIALPLISLMPLLLAISVTYFAVACMIDP